MKWVLAVPDIFLQLREDPAGKIIATELVEFISATSPENIPVKVDLAGAVTEVKLTPGRCDRRWLLDRDGIVAAG